MTSYFLSSSLSKTLCDIGVVSTISNESFCKLHQKYHSTPAIHVFDLMLPENAKKVWGDVLMCEVCGSKKCAAGEFYCEDYKTANMLPEWEYHSGHLLFRVQHSEHNWQSFVEQEVDRRLSEKL